MIELHFKECGEVEEAIHTFSNGIKALITRDGHYFDNFRKISNKYTYIVSCCGELSPWMEYKELLKYMDLLTKRHVLHRSDIHNNPKQNDTY